MSKCREYFDSNAKYNETLTIFYYIKYKNWILHADDPKALYTKLEKVFKEEE